MTSPGTELWAMELGLGPGVTPPLGSYAPNVLVEGVEAAG